jgi:hypothetical protein
MCHGGLDARFITHDIEARMKGVAFGRQNKEEPTQPARGLIAALRAWVEGLRRKDDVHV